MQTLVPEAITLRIATIRGQRVIMDADLAALYGVETKRFNEAVKRNLVKFPRDFMFTLTAEEFAGLRSQIATSNNQALAKRLDELEQRTEALAMSHDTFSRNTRVQLRQVIDALRELTSPPPDAPRRPIGFVTPQDKSGDRAVSGQPQS